MPKVQVLPPELASQIAAGEVAERPSSVVKELVENALDAGATRCDVEIESGGIVRLSVSDDGHGMSPEDAALALERHATSKLRTLADLTRVSSYGFRGEALPSIASVSRLSLRTRERAAEAGVELSIEGGKQPVARAVGMAPGTRLDVNDLFFNVPARRKFLRSSATEAGHVTEVIENAALARPDVTFSLVRDGRKVREFLRVTSRAERVAQVLAETELAPCRGERGPLGVEAFLSRPEAARAGAGGLFLFVNGRPVRDRSVAATIAHAYGSVLERGRYPRGVVYLDLPLELVDVNVHPQKAEVRFADPRAVTDAIYGLLARALASSFSLPPRPRAAPSFARPLPAAAESTAAVAAPPPPTVPLRAPEILRDEPRAAASAPEPPLAVADSGCEGAPAWVAFRDAARAPIQPSPEVTWSSLRFVAQLRHTYLVCEGADGVYLLDQHAAAERVTFTRLRHEYRSRAVPSQALLFPVMVEVTSDEAELVERFARQIAEVGIDARVRGPETVSVHGVPRLLSRASPERILRDLLAELSRQGQRAFSDAVDLALATMACHGSVRAGDSLAASEVQALLAQLDHADFAGHCPHGRPVVTFTAWSELERKVGRR